MDLNCDRPPVKYIPCTRGMGTNNTRANNRPYSKWIFGMFSGEERRVTLEVSNRLVSVIIDRFGKDLLLSKVDGERFSVSVEVAVIRQFLAWAFALGTDCVLPARKTWYPSCGRKLAVYGGSISLRLPYPIPSSLLFA